MQDAINLQLIDGSTCYLPGVIASRDADRLFETLRAEVTWRQEEIFLFGRRRPVPRLVAWHGDSGAEYRYSGVLHVPEPWSPTLQHVRLAVEELAGQRFNSVLLNLYRDGRDGMGWHSDDETELGPNPVIASVSLGATRHFRMRHKRHKGEALGIDLEHGSVLLMQGATQHHWVHALPKTRRPSGERINLTFRLVTPRGDERCKDVNSCRPASRPAASP